MASETCGTCGMEVLAGGNHAAVNHPGGAATPFDWRPQEWKDNTQRRNAAAKKPIAAAPATGYKETSYDAWIASLPALGEVQRGILDCYHRFGPLTDEQLYDAYTADKPQAYRNTVLPARTGLYKVGLVRDTGQKRKVRSGREAIVWGLPGVVQAS